MLWKCDTDVTAVSDHGTRIKSTSHAPFILIIVWKVKYLFITFYCQRHSTRYTAVWINNYFHYERSGYDFCFKRNPSRATAKSTLFTVSKDEWDTKEDIGKSTKNALYVLRCVKDISRDEATLNRENIKPVALAVIKLRWSEGIRQAVS